MQKEKRAVNIILSSREVVARDLPHPTMLSLLNRKQQPYFMREAEYPDPAGRHKPSGMTPNFKGVGPVFARPARTGAPLRSGFTLIELLVVILIIGILAAVALPQYQKAVEKAKAAQALTMLKSVYQAAKAYKLANGSWPNSFDELALDIPWTTTNQWFKTIASFSNNDWAVSLWTDTYSGENPYGVTVGRISGPYAGAGFIIYDTPLSQFSAEEVICIETGNPNTYKHPFSKNRGDYCQKIFKGTFVPTNHWENYFKLP